MQMRISTLLVARGVVDDAKAAAALVLAGNVFVRGDHKITSPAQKVAEARAAAGAGEARSLLGEPRRPRAQPRPRGVAPTRIHGGGGLLRGACCGVVQGGLHGRAARERLCTRLQLLRKYANTTCTQFTGRLDSNEGTSAKWIFDVEIEKLDS